MFRKCLVLLFLTNLFAGHNADQTIYVDGWVPISRDQVYNQIHKQWAHNILYTSVIPPKDLTSSVKPVKVWPRIANSNQNAENVDEIKLADKVIKSIELSNIILNKNEEIISVDNLRKAKKLTYKSALKNVDENKVMDTEQYFDDNKQKSSNNVMLITASDKYDVTEEPLDDLRDNNDEIDKETGYKYETPPLPDNDDLTSKFQKILAKYNINADDKLKNYDLSRERKIGNRLQFQHYMPFHLRKYNSQNHLPVDPLLAVFLSNYGFYLPSLYGIKANYNNLYGYLASNNIHNNRPFGLYKVFSDTDSLN